jgi:uncharacterized membrane protein YdjX (TVP38/TMEM64 family)
LYGPGVTEGTPDRWRPYRRVGLGVLVLAFVAIAIYVWRTGAVTPSSIKAWLLSLGPWGPVVFVGAFGLGTTVGLPGMAFVIGARLAFGPWLGLALGYGGGLIAVTLPFVTARALGRNRKAPWRPKQAVLQRAFEQLEVHPIRSVMLLRVVLWFNPPISYALAFAPIRFTTYFFACAIALAPIVIAANLATSWFV